MNIFQKMSAMTAELQTVAKNLTVSTGGKNSYKAVSERDIIDAVKPLEIKHGVYSYPCDRELLESMALESENTDNGTPRKKTTFFSRIKTTYRFVNIDDPSDFIETVTFAEGIDPQDKGSGKAMTYADKYALMKAYKISTGDDPDQAASIEENYNKTTAKQYGGKKTVTESGSSAGSITSVTTATCSECGSSIRSIMKKDGETWDVAEIARYSQRRFGKVLCPECQRKALKNES